MTARTAYTAGKDTQLTCRKLSLNLDYASDWASSLGMLFSAEKSEHLQIVPKLRTSINLMSLCTVRTFLGWRLINIWAFISTAACPGKTTLIMSTPTVPGRLAFCAAYNASSGQQLFGRSSSEHIRPQLEYACPVWSGGNNSKLVKLQELFCRRHQIVLPQLQQRFDYHTLVLFFKIKSNLAPPYLTELLPQLSSHCGYNFRKNLYPVPAVKKVIHTHEFLSTIYYPMEQLAIRHPEQHITPKVLGRPQSIP